MIRLFRAEVKYVTDLSTAKLLQLCLIQPHISYSIVQHFLVNGYIALPIQVEPIFPRLTYSLELVTKLSERPTAGKGHIS